MLAAFCFSNNDAKTYWYGLETLENIEIKHVFQSKATLHTSILAVDTQRCFKTSYRRLIGVETTSCVYWTQLTRRSIIKYLQGLLICFKCLLVKVKIIKCLKANFHLFKIYQYLPRIQESYYVFWILEKW